MKPIPKHSPKRAVVLHHQDWETILAVLEERVDFWSTEQKGWKREHTKQLECEVRYIIDALERTIYLRPAGHHFKITKPHDLDSDPEADRLYEFIMAKVNALVDEEDGEKLVSGATSLYSEIFGCIEIDQSLQSPETDKMLLQFIENAININLSLHSYISRNPLVSSEETPKNSKSVQNSSKS